MSRIFLFDGVCLLCSRAVRYVLQHEKQSDMRFVAIQSAEGQKLAVEFGIDPINPQSFAFIEDGTAHTRSDGVMALLRHVGGPARSLRIGRWLPRRFRDLVYDLVAANRYRLFGRSARCLAVGPSERHRFSLPEV